MAKAGQTLESLYIELGLDLSKLQADILAADRTITENLGRLNREKNTIKLRMEADIASLDRVKDATKILEIREEALTKQLTLQTDRMKILEAAYRQVANNANSTAKAVQNAEQAFLREKIVVGQLQQQLRDLASQKTPSTPINSLLSGYQNYKGNVTGTLNELSSAFSNLTSATSSADAALTAALTTIGSMPTPIGKTVAALASLPVVFLGIENSVVDLIKATASAGDATYVMSRGFQMSIADTGKFTAMCKTAGVEVNDLASTIKRTQQQIIRGGEHAKAETWLKRYGETAFDASGHLKDLNEMTLTLSRALKRAQADGNGMAFVLGTMRGASAAAITAIEDAAGVYEQASHLVKNGLANPALAHEVQGNINAMNLQASFMHATFKSALLPVANEIIPRMTERMGKFTSLIKDNKDVILDFGRTGAEAFLKIEEGAEKVLNVGLAIGKFFHDLKVNPVDEKIVEKYKNNADIKSIDDLIKAEQPEAYDIIKADPKLYAQTVAKYEPTLKALDDTRKEIERKQAELDKLLKQPISWANASAIGQERTIFDQNDELLETFRRARKYREEADAILYKSSHSDYESKIFDLQNWYSQLLREEKKSTDERLAIEELYNAKFEQIQREQQEELKKTAEKAQEYWKNAADIQYEMTHTAFEKELRDIELWKDAQAEKAATAEETAGIIANAAAKEAQAFEREIDRIKGTMQSIDDKIFELDHSQYENDLRRIQQEYLRAVQDAQKAGTLPLMKDKLDYLYQRQKQELDKKAAGGGDYTKSPNGGLQRGGNGVVVIGGDTVLDDGLTQAQTKNIDLLVDENKIREQLLPNLSDAGREFVAAQQAVKNFADTQNLVTQATEKAASGFQLIEGDQVVGMPELPTESVQQFDLALQQSAIQVEQANPAEALTSAENQLAENLKQALPTEYFRNMANGIENISGLQQRLAESTLELIDAQGALKEALKTTPTSAKEEDGGYQQLSYKNPNALEPLPTPQQGRNWQLGFDMDTAGTVLGLGALLAGIGGAPITAPIAAGIAGLAAFGGLAMGSSWDATNAPQANVFGTADLTEIIAPLTSIDNKIDTVITPLSSIEKIVGQIFSALSNQEARQINVSPNVDIDLGGAYVFDNDMKLSLVEDITNRIVTAITETVEKATSQRTYGFST